MKFFRGFIIRWLFKFLDSGFGIDYRKINKEATEKWAFDSFHNVGWRSYFAYEDLKILKDLARGHDRDSYMIMIGRRLQLMHLFNEMRKAFENRKSAQDKAKPKEK